MREKYIEERFPRYFIFGKLLEAADLNSARRLTQPTSGCARCRFQR